MTEIQPTADPEPRSTIDVLAASAGAVGSVVKMVGSAAFTLLLLVCAVRTATAGDWLSGAVASVMTIGLALVTRVWYRRLRADLARARSPQS